MPGLKRQTPKLMPATATADSRRCGIESPYSRNLASAFRIHTQMFVCPVPSTTCTVFVSSTAIQRSSCNPLATADGFEAGVSARVALKAGLWSETCFLVGKREAERGNT
jgi:hypothetical protein